MKKLGIIVTALAWLAFATVPAFADGLPPFNFQGGKATGAGAATVSTPGTPGLFSCFSAATAFAPCSPQPGTAAFDNTGTTGATIPLNNGGFTQSGAANFTGAVTATGLPTSGTVAAAACLDSGGDLLSIAGGCGLGGVSSVSGTAGQITVSPTTGATVVSLPATITSAETFSGAIALTSTTLPTQAAGTLGLGGIATAPTLAAPGEGDVYLSTTNGLIIQGYGTNDVVLATAAGTSVITIIHNNANVYVPNGLVQARAFQPTSSVNPTDGMNLVATHTPAFYANSIEVAALTSTSIADVGFLTIGSLTPATASAGEAALVKETASGTAPGAGYLKFEAVAGTNAGSCKIITYAGTSSTPVTIVDNVGSGC